VFDFLKKHVEIVAVENSTWKIIASLAAPIFEENI